MKEPNGNQNYSPSSLNQRDFMSILPLELLPTIFSYLSQQDCVNSMAVCRDWYSLVPQYSQGVWEYLRISQRNVYKINKRWEKSVGEHVKKVVFLHILDENQLYQLMQKLYDCNCTKLKSIEFIRSATANQDMFLPLLQQLASHITKIEMLRHRTNVSFLHLLSVCPVVTHFTFQAATDSYDDYGVYDKEPKVSIPITLQNHFPNLVYLRMNTIMDEQLRVEPILEKCPNLRSFIGPEYETYIATTYFGIVSKRIRLEKLMSWCPEMSYIQTLAGYGYFSSTIRHRISEVAYSNSNGTEKGPCLRQLATSSYYDDQLIPLLTTNRQSLEYLSLRSFIHGIDWYQILQSTSFTSLHTLAFCNCNFDAAFLVALLNNCPVIETLVLRDTQRTYNYDILEQLESRDRLRTLELADAIFEDDRAIAVFIDRFPALKTLHVLSSVLPLELFARIHHLIQLDLRDIQWTYSATSYQEAVMNICMPSIKPKLEVLRIQSRSITFELLQRFVDSGSLQEVHVQLDHALCGDDNIGLVRLFNTLKKSPISVLQLDNISQLTYDALDALSDVPRLARFTTKWVFQRDNTAVATRVDKAGLMQLLRKRISLRHVRLSNVVLIENDNVIAHDHVMKDILKTCSCYASCYVEYGPFSIQDSGAKSVLIQHPALIE